MKFQINSTQYHIDEFNDGFAWVSASDSSEAFPTALEAYQDAITYEALISAHREEELAQRLQDEIYGTYEQQVFQTYQSQIRG